MRRPLGIQRKHARHRFRLPAWIDLGDRVCIALCEIKDISKGGAMLAFAEGEIIPTKFVLRLTDDGSVGRICERMWCSPTQAGVKFLAKVNGHEIEELESFPPLAPAD